MGNPHFIDEITLIRLLLQHHSSLAHASAGADCPYHQSAPRGGLGGWYEYKNGKIALYLLPRRIEQYLT